MATKRFFCRNTQTNPGTGGAAPVVYDLNQIQGTSTTVTSATVSPAVGTYLPVLAFQTTLSDVITSTSYPVSLNINGISTNGQLIWRVQRVNASNTLQATSTDSVARTTTGTFSQVMTLSTTWAINDRLRLLVLLTRTNTMGGANVTLSVNNASSFISYDYRRIFAVS